MAAIDAPATPLELFLITTLFDGGHIAPAVEELRAAGLGDKVDSWISTGENQPLTADELSKALGDSIARIAAIQGLSTDEVAEKAAAALPVTFDALSPEGQVVTQ
ncbi:MULTISPECIES: YidB family protein [unclassified Streptomyces]|uniref:YidB family protein n=1 Tax=unclassified Streptomyces TaxID=2593676 RepID=UPI0015572D73|nr:YidB family protein [Streptomyces sp. MNP-20]